MSLTKRCSKCGNEYPATSEYFGYESSEHTLLKAICKGCHRIACRFAMQRSRQQHPEYAVAHNQRRRVRDRVIGQERTIRLAIVRCLKALTAICAMAERLEGKLTVAQVADYCGLPPPIVGHYIHGPSRPRLIACDKVRQRLYFNKADVETWFAEYSAKTHRVRLKGKVSDEEYRAIRLAKKHAAKKQYYAAHPDRRAAERKRNRDRHPDKKREHYRRRTRNRRASLAQAVGNYTTADLVAQAKRQKGKCYWCGAKLGKHPHTDYHPDHVLPLSKSLDNSKDNIVAACPQCNIGKGDKMPWEWSGNGGKLL